MAASCSSAETQESEGYFSFQSVGLLEPEEVVQQTQKDSRDDQYKVMLRLLMPILIVSLTSSVCPL